MTEEEIKELIKKEVTLRGLIAGKPLKTRFKIIKTIKEIKDKKYIFVFVFDNDDINYKNEEELLCGAFLFLEEKNNALKTILDM